MVRNGLTGLLTQAAEAAAGGHSTAIQTVVAQAAAGAARGVAAQLRELTGWAAVGVAVGHKIEFQLAQTGVPVSSYLDISFSSQS